MKKFRVVFGNVMQCFIFLGKVSGEQSFGEYLPQLFIQQSRKLHPDILCLAEFPIELNPSGETFAESLSKAIGLDNYKVSRNDQSWIVPGMDYGLAIFSKFPLLDYEYYLLPNPGLSSTKENGAVWTTHNKGVQKIVLNVQNRELNLFNLHYFPFHHFGKKFTDPAFAHIHGELLEIIRSQGNGQPVIVTGDFNNKGIPLHQALPSLFQDGYFKACPFSGATIVGEMEQIDHILYRPTHLECKQLFLEKSASDHYFLIADFAFKLL